MSLRSFFMPTLVLLASAALLVAQEPGNQPPAKQPPAAQPPAKQPPAAQPPEKQPPAAQPPAARPADDGGQPAMEQFSVVLEQWKALLKDLRELQIRYRAASEAESTGLRAQWNALITKGHELLPELRTKAVAAYVESPNEDLTLVRFLVKMLDDDVKRDQFQDAIKLGQTLIDNDCDVKSIYKQAGVAYFALHDFDKAEKYLAKAAEAAPLDGRSADYLDNCKKYKQYWAEEQAIRKKEAEADEANALPRVKLTTSKGEIVVELFENEAPDTVGNFISLVESGFYNGLTFHRVLPNFMAQGGCPRGDGSGGPGYEIYCESHKENYRKHFRGTLSMAHAGKDTGGSQFFITFTPTPALNGKHTAFGRVIEGMDVLAKLQRRDPTAKPPLPIPDKIEKAEVLRKRNHEYLPKKKV